MGVDERDIQPFKVWPHYQLVFIDINILYLINF